MSTEANSVKHGHTVIMFLKKWWSVALFASVLALVPPAAIRSHFVLALVVAALIGSAAAIVEY
jgi:hypothetical protein